jgi:CubicO group peptidase (beta-lactamase class C family)
LEELKGSVWDTVTLEEALDMATGLNGTEHDEAEQNSRTDPDQIWYRWAATSAVGMVPDVRGRNESWVDVLRSMERKTPGHQKFEYNSINTFVVNRIAERVADKPLFQQVSERIWSKLGMEHDTYYMVSPSGNTLGFMGVNSSLRDMARFGMAFTPSAETLAGAQIIPDAIMEKINDRTYLEQFDKGWAGHKFTNSFSDDAGKISNRYQWDSVTSEGDLYKSGVGGQGIYISPSTNTVVAWFATGKGDDQEESMARAIVKAIN